MKKNSFVVCCDVDNVVNNLIEHTLEFYNQKHESNYQFEDVTTYQLNLCLPNDVADEMQEMFLDKKLWDGLTPIEGAINGIKELVSCGYDVYFVTSTNPINFPWKVKWLQKFFPFVHSNNIVCIQDKSLLKADVMIEDCYQNLIDSKLSGHVLLDYPWNQAFVDKDYVYSIYRANNWSQIVDYVKEIYKEFNRM